MDKLKADLKALLEKHDAEILVNSSDSFLIAQLSNSRGTLDLTSGYNNLKITKNDL